MAIQWNFIFCLFQGKLETFNVKDFRYTYKTETWPQFLHVLVLSVVGQNLCDKLAQPYTRAMWSQMKMDHMCRKWRDSQI